jgi:hypothetical protein
MFLEFDMISAEMSRKLAAVAQILSPADRFKLMDEVDSAKSDEDLRHWLSDEVQNRAKVWAKKGFAYALKS